MLYRPDPTSLLRLSESFRANANLPTAPEDLRRRDFTVRQDPPQKTLRDPTLAPVRTGFEDSLLQFHRSPMASDGLDGRVAQAATDARRQAAHFPPIEAHPLPQATRRAPVARAAVLALATPAEAMVRPEILRRE
jgi:hypothetical protein